MSYSIPQEVQNLMDKFSRAGYQIYIVGGSVRGLLMGTPVTDWDFTTDATPEEILKLFPNGFYDNKFGTVGIPIKDTSEVYEVTTMRKEGVYEDFRRPLEVGWTNKIEEDLARRDFTINAIALSCHPALDAGSIDSRFRSPRCTPRVDTGEAGGNDDVTIIDPFSGQADLQNKLVRAVGNPGLRFKEDALRLIRAIRIATQLGFNIENNTLKAIQKDASLIKEIAGERIRDEFFKLLVSMNPRLPRPTAQRAVVAGGPSPGGEAPGGQAYMGIIKLREAGILQIILPELEKCFGVMQEGPKHVREYDIGEHSLLTLKEITSDDPLVKLAALLHDIGKPETIKVDKGGNVTFYQHDVVGGKIVLQIAKRFHLSRKQTDKLFRLVRWHLFTVDENQTDSAIRRFIKNVGLENLDDMMALRVGDRLGGGTQKAVSWRMEEFQERIKQVLQKPFSIADLKVNGEDVMKVLNIKPGPKVGEILNKLFEEVLEDASKNDRNYLLERIKEIS